MLLAVLLAAGTMWTARREATRQRDEAARREQVRRELTETLDEAQQLSAEAPEDWRQDPLRRTRIRELAHRAETLTESSWSEPTLAGAVRTLHDRIRAEDADGRLLDSLEKIRLRLLRAAQPNHPGDFWINQNLGLVYYLLPDRRLDESVRFFTAALAIWETGAAYLNLGAALVDLQRYAEAEQVFRAALRLQPDYAHAHLGLAEVLQLQNRVEEALASVERALAIVPDLPEAVALRDQLRASIGKRRAGGDAKAGGDGSR